MSEELQRRELYYSGRVQGVGFRATTQQIATGHAVTGFVRNLPDGRVQLIVEGAPVHLEEFLAAVRQRLGRYITSVHEVTEPASGEFPDFTIRR